MRKFVVGGILLLGCALVILSFSELENILTTLMHADLRYLALGLVILTAWFFVLGWIFQSIYRLLGLQESTRQLTLVAAASSFVNIVAPSGGFGGVALFLTDGHNRGHLPGKVTVASALYLLLDEAAFLCILALGLSVLVRRNNLDAAEITASAILLVIASVLAFLLYFGYRSPRTLGSALAKISAVINRIAWPIIHREYLSQARAYAFAAEIADGLGSIPAKPRSLLVPFLLSLANKALLIGVLICSFLSFQVPFTAGTIIAGFSIGYLFLIVSPTPSGIGVVEGALALTLVSLDVDLSHAVLITFVYRGITFWLPLAVGALAFRALHLETIPPLPRNHLDD
jgi:uncharacterized protein (TIRG00374 family)